MDPHSLASPRSLAPAAAPDPGRGSRSAGASSAKQPPREILCEACGHWKHPRAARCREAGANDCRCECLKHQAGVRKKRQRDAVASSEGTWNFAQHRRVIHQAKFAAECMSRCRAVYAVLVAHRLESGGIASELWGSAPWVENELAGQTGALELIWKGKAAQHLSRPRNEGVGEYDVVFESLRRDGLGHLCETFRANGVDDAAFRALGGEEQTAADKHLRDMGVEGVGERVKILDAARRERTPERGGAAPEATTRGGDVGSERTGEDADAAGAGGAGSAAVPARVLVGMQRGGEGDGAARGRR